MAAQFRHTPSPRPAEYADVSAFQAAFDGRDVARVANRTPIPTAPAAGASPAPTEPPGVPVAIGAMGAGGMHSPIEAGMPRGSPFREE